MDDLRPPSYGIASAMFVIGTISILMRIYVRGFAMRAFYWDDWTMTAMLFFNAGQQGFIYYFIQHGAGLHITEVMTKHPLWLPKLMKALLIQEFYYIWIQFVVKMCFLLFFFRLSVTPKFRLALWAVIAFNVITTIILLMLYGLQCIPIEAFYDKEKYPTVKCLDTNVTYWIPYTLNMATDIFIFILPLPVIMNLQMTLKRRIGVLAVITTGGSAVLVSGLRAIILYEFGTSPDFTWSLGKMVIISSVEVQVAIVAANMPALKAFYSCWRDKRLGPGQGISEHSSQRTPKASAGSQGGIELQSGITVSRTNRSKSTPGVVTLSATESEEKLFQWQTSTVAHLPEERSV